jgi:FkbM family methyltransferase
VGRITKTYHFLRLATPPGFRSKFRNAIENLFALSAREYYSQFGEDAILQAYFERKARTKNPESFIFFLKPRLEPGFYVDVGAYMPKRISNTYCFYKRGWRGINIDATPGSMKAFNLVRQRDINLEVAVSDREMQLLLRSWDGGWKNYNSLSLEESPSGNLPHDHQPPREVRVQSLRLDTILDRYLPAGQSINFLSVDVERHELAVLRSNDWRRYRPELVVVEQHKDAIQEILESDVARFLEEVGYSLYSWAKPSLIYKADEIA